MAASELISKTISRLTFLNCQGNTQNAKTARGITTASRYQNYSQAEKDLINNALTQYAGFEGNIIFYEGIGDIGAEQIKQAVAEHKELTGNTPLVMIDYLQILAPYDMRASDKQNTDKAVLELKRLSRDYKTPVIGISSLNRQGYKGEVSLEDFKESGAIEYGSDVLIGLHFSGAGKKDFDSTEAKRANPRKIELVILKNRNGSKGEAPIDFYPMFNYFTDQEPLTINTDKEGNADEWSSAESTYE